jgi:hypothetical protein
LRGVATPTCSQAVSSARRSSFGVTGNADAGGKAKSLQTITLKLPLAYMEIMEKEANRLGLRRGQFLTLLLQRKRGEVSLERTGELPDYNFSGEELRTTKIWLWYVTPEVRAQIEEDRYPMGPSTIGGWITQLINKWIGRPDGLRVGVNAPRSHCVSKRSCS